MPYRNEHAARMRPPSDFDKATFRRISIKSSPGVSAIVGKMKGSKTPYSVQAYRFDKSTFTMKDVHEWLKDHDKKPMYVEPAIEGEGHWITVDGRRIFISEKDVPRQVRKLPPGLREIWLGTFADTRCERNHAFSLAWRAVRSVHKGGEGSGNFGHAGRPGEVGGSAPSDSAASGGLDLTSPVLRTKSFCVQQSGVVTAKREVVGKLLQKSVLPDEADAVLSLCEIFPASAFDHIKEISFSPPPPDKDWPTPTDSEGREGIMFGCFDSSTGIMHLNRFMLDYESTEVGVKELVFRETVAHELGHSWDVAVYGSSPLSFVVLDFFLFLQREGALDDFRDVDNMEAQRSLWEVGLEANAFLTPDEFIATVYQVVLTAPLEETVSLLFGTLDAFHTDFRAKFLEERLKERMVPAGRFVTITHNGRRTLCLMPIEVPAGSIERYPHLFFPLPLMEKGGEGSGNFDHAGRPGEVGGSAPRGDVASTGNDLPVAYEENIGLSKFMSDNKIQAATKEQVQDLTHGGTPQERAVVAYVAQYLPRSAFDKVKGIYFEPPEKYTASAGHKWSGPASNDAIGVYDLKTGKVFLNVSRIADVAGKKYTADYTRFTLAHELGHAYTSGKPAKGVSKIFANSAELGRLRSPNPVQRVGLSLMGLRPYSFTSPREFTADATAVLFSDTKGSAVDSMFYFMDSKSPGLSRDFARSVGIKESDIGVYELQPEQDGDNVVLSLHEIRVPEEIVKNAPWLYLRKKDATNTD
jgi:hypothetical protein